MNNKLIPIILLILISVVGEVFAQGSMTNEERTDYFFFFGKPDEVAIKKNIAFKEVMKATDNNEGMARTIAFYHYMDIVVEINNKKVGNAKLSDRDYIKFLLGDAVVDDVLGDLDNSKKTWQDLRKQITKGVQLGTVKKVNYTATISRKKINFYKNKYEDIFENLSFIIFIDTTKIEDDIHILDNGAKGINKNKMRAGILEELEENWLGSKGKIGQIFRTKGFNVKTTSQKNINNDYNCMVEFGDSNTEDLQKRAFYASADYYIIISIDNLTIKYEFVGDNAEPSWQIPKAEFSFTMRNVANNDEVSYIKIESDYNYVSALSGNDAYEYREPFSDLMYEGIAPQLAMMAVQLEKKEKYDEFFPQIYQYMGQMSQDGYEFRIYVERTGSEGANEIKQFIEKNLSNEYDGDFDFEVFDFTDINYDNCIYGRSAYISLKNCFFDISDFNSKLEDLLEGDLDVAFQKPKTPKFFTLLIKEKDDIPEECNQQIRWDSETRVVICPKLKYEDFVYDKSMNFEIEDEKGNPFHHNCRIRPVDDALQITLQEKDVFKIGEKYTIYFDGKNIKGKCKY